MSTIRQADDFGAETSWPGAKAQQGHEQEYTGGYLHLVDRYGMIPRRTHLDLPQEDGEV